MQWLKEYPNIEVKGLTEAIEKYIIRLYPAKIEIPAVTVQSEEMKQ